jgi:hypothetical protein
MLKQLFITLLTSMVLISASIGSVSADADTPEILLSQILPPDLAQSVYHRVEDVTLNGRYYRFQVDSQFGRYDILSLAMLRVRVHEFRILGEAITQFNQREQQLSDVLRSQLQVRADSAIDILVHPLATAADLAGQLAGDRNDTRSGRMEDTPLSSYEAMYQSTEPTLALHKRNVANQWGLDVYSSNLTVQKFLNAVARVRASGKPSAGAPYVGSHLGTPLTISDKGIEIEISRLLRKNDPTSLRQHNDEILAAMNIQADTRRLFLQQSKFSPRHQTRITHYLKGLEGVKNRMDFIQSALSIQSEFVALAFEEAAIMLVHYHNNVRPLKKIHAGKNLLHAITADGRIVAFLPVDVVNWSTETESLFNDLVRQARSSSYSAWELVTAGMLTDQVRSQLLNRQFVLSENVVK